jgi:hypothetical protein
VGVDQRFVVEVTEPVDPADLERVVERMSVRWKQPRERFLTLLEDRVGPVTQPLQRAPAERVADVLRDAGVAVTVGEVHGPTAPSTRWLPSPHEATERELQDVTDAGWSPADWLDDPDRLATGGSWSGSGTGAPIPLGGGVERPATAMPALGMMPPPPAPIDPPTPTAREGWLETDRRLAKKRQRMAEDPWIDEQDDRSPPWRRPLVTMLVLALVVLLLLQGGLALFGGRPASYQQGLVAYRHADFAAAKRVWEPVAEAGDPRAQFMLGYLSELGLGQPWSNAAAAPWYRQAAERGNALAQARLASLYARGMGVAHDEAAASRWYQAAAQGGLIEAQVELGRRLLVGLGVERDLVQARFWLQQAGSRGHLEAAELALLLAP